MGKKRKKRSPRGTGGGFPVLSDMTARIPAGGLLDPSLRKGFGNVMAAKRIPGK